MKIIVSGADGQLGSEFNHVSNAYPQHTFVFANRKVLDITSQESIAQFFDENKPDIFINCAAYTAVDKAEEEIAIAKNINEIAPGVLAKYCQDHGCILIHYSSDYVYHCEVSEPMTELNDVNPQGVYARTKLAGEKNIIANCDRSLIIRTSWVYSSFGNNFVKTMLRLGRAKEALTVVNDQIGTPTYARDIAEATLELIPQITASGFSDFGIYNYSNTGVTNWMAFAKTIFELEKIKCNVYPTTTQEYGAPAERPLWSVLSKEKIKNVFSLKIPSWETSLKKCLLDLK